MAQSTVSRTALTGGLTPPATAAGGDDTGTIESRREWFRAVVPPAVAVALLFGLVVVGGLALRDLVDLGVWLLSSH